VNLTNSSPESFPPPPPPPQNEAQNVPYKSQVVSRLGVGILMGIIFAAVGAFIFNFITNLLGSYYYFLLIPLGYFGGLGFGIFTKGNGAVRGLFGLGFGLAAMLIGLWLVFTTAINIGGGTLIAPSSVMSFSEFLDLLDYLCILAGIVAAFFAGKK
jgi:hypothetical protein